MKRYLCAVAVMVYTITTFAAFQVKDDKAKGTLHVTEGTSPVLTFCYGDQLPGGVDKKYTRSCYIHPLWSPGGEVITDDFPKDHPHHHGVFWAWPVVKVREQTTQNWHPHDPPLRHHFVKWLEQTVDDTGATISLENRWLLDNNEEVAREQVQLVIHPQSGLTRYIDVGITIQAVGGPLTLQGTHEGRKGYGGFCWRAAPALGNAIITTESGISKDDLVNQDHWWVDLSTSRTGMAILPGGQYPELPPKWMARKSYAGFVNVSWPGLEPVTLEEDQSVSLRQRLYLHDGRLNSEEIDKAARSYLTEESIR